MIYLNHISKLKSVYVPRCRDRVGDLKISLRNTVNQSVLVVTDIECDEFQLHYLLRFYLPDNFPYGECEYTLMDDGGVISSGILMVEDYKCPNEYHNAIQYEQFE